MFDNEVNEGRPVCPVCEQPCQPDQGATSGAYAFAGALFIVHHECAGR